MAIPLGRPLRVFDSQSNVSLNINTRIAGGRIIQEVKEPSKVNTKKIFISFYFIFFFT